MTAIDRTHRPLDAVENNTAEGSQSPFEYSPRVRGGSFASVVFMVMVAWLMLLGYGALWLYNVFNH